MFRKYYAVLIADTVRYLYLASILATGILYGKFWLMKYWSNYTFDERFYTGQELHQKPNFFSPNMAWAGGWGNRVT